MPTCCQRLAPVPWTAPMLGIQLKKPNIISTLLLGEHSSAGISIRLGKYVTSEHQIFCIAKLICMIVDQLCRQAWDPQSRPLRAITAPPRQALQKSLPPLRRSAQ